MDKWLFERLSKAVGEKVCTDDELDYYSLVFNGQRLMYAKNRYRPDGVKMYFLSDELAHVLGFASMEELRLRIRGPQYFRNMLSVKALKRHFL